MGISLTFLANSLSISCRLRLRERLRSVFFVPPGTCKSGLSAIELENKTKIKLLFLQFSRQNASVNPIEEKSLQFHEKNPTF